MKKNLFSILLVVVMTMALVACGSQPTNVSAPEATETVNEVVENSETVSESEQTIEVDEPESSEATSEPEQATEAPVGEVASTPDDEVVETVQEPEPNEPEFTFTEVTATKYATQSVNVRSGPSTDFDKIGSLSTNQEIQVISRCSETGWYKFIWTDGNEVCVSDKYLADEKVEVAPPASNNSGSGSEASDTGSTSTECPYPMYQVIDDGGDSVYYYCTESDINWTIYDQCAEIIANRHGHSLYQNGGDCGKGGGLGPVKTNYTYNGQTVYRQRPCAFISPPGAGPAGATEVFQCP